MPFAARVGDTVLQDSPHCHAPIHPAAPVPTPSAHPALPLAIVTGSPTVLVGGAPAARVTDQTAPCTLPSCVPAGPGVIARGSATVKINGLLAARVGDTTLHPTCVGPIPAPNGTVKGPGYPRVNIGG